MNITRKRRISKRTLFFAYFIVNIVIGFILLKLPFSWNGEKALNSIDALFTAVSAICVTGLITVDTASYSLFGQIVLLYLIEAGGLGIITFSTLYLIFPGRRISIENRKMIESYTLGNEKIGPKTIVKFILTYTLLIQFLGFIFLSLSFSSEGIDQPFLNGLFHSISAFCNAGFSRFSNSLEGFTFSVPVNISISFLIIMGGIGFLVVWDIIMKFTHQKRNLQFHTRIMLVMTPLLIIIGAVVFLIFEWNDLFKGFNVFQKIISALFQSITTRTAGFNTLPEGDFTLPSKMFSLLLMLIGAGSGSTGGGIKVTTFFILVLIISRGIDDKGDIYILNRRLKNEDVSRASMFVMKAIVILFICLFFLLITESISKTDVSLMDVVFESVSALGTVGLSTGITSQLSTLGKLVIICTMFAGRVGLFSMIMPENRPIKLKNVEYPNGEVLIG